MNSLSGLRPVFALGKLLLALVALTGVWSCEVQAMTAGSSVSYWQPDQVPGLSASEVQYLQQAHCLVESYRDDSVAPRKSGSPDENDVLLLARGELAEKGRDDLAVYCKAADITQEFFLVKWAGHGACASKFQLREQSMFFKKHGTQHDYYGDFLRVLAPTEVLADINESHEAAYGAGYVDPSPERWRIPIKGMPAIERDALAYVGYYHLYLYCDQGRWVKLLDSYSDELD